MSSLDDNNGASAQQTMSIKEAVDLAVKNHREGRLPRAETIYRQILQAYPEQFDALHLLGVIAHQMGNNDEAIELISRAIGVRPESSEAHNNLGNALEGCGEIRKAAASYQKALDFKPDFAEARYNLGNALQELGELKDAIASYKMAVVLKPDFAEIYNNLGTALQKLGDLEEAVSGYKKTLELKPDFATGHFNLGTALQHLGKPEEAIQCHQRAVTLSPESDLFWASFASSLENASFTSADERFYQTLLYLIDRPSIRPNSLIRPIISALRCHPNFSPIIEAVISNRENGTIPYRDFAKQLSEISLFLRILELNPIFDLKIEQMLTTLRRAMLQDTMEAETEVEVLSFSVALAHNSFTNEYVFTETEEETKTIEKLERRIAALVKNGQDVPPSFIVTLGAYRSLLDFPWAQKLSQQECGENVRPVIRRQITEPLEERSLHDKIPSITPIQDTTSQSVRTQYEENPYPRWTKIDLVPKSWVKHGGSVASILKNFPFNFDLGDYTAPEKPVILVAGCGTGQHPLHTASRFSNAQVLAVDLSLSSLSYAQRKTTELGFPNIEYVQGDILELSNLERRFDIIECSGVLHHLSDPLAGWQVLADLLNPGGLMKIGLYSKTARQHIIQGRSFIAEKGYGTSPTDIRRCRQDIVSLAADGDTEMTKISNRNDFFSMSECRDLLFHVQEHQFTLPQIEESLESLGLKFLGFEMKNYNVLKQFRDSHSSSSALTPLSLWHEFELNNPETFTGMYQFWCQNL